MNATEEVTDPKRVILECGRSRNHPIVITLPCLMKEGNKERNILEGLARTFAECGYELGFTLLCQEEGSEEIIERGMKLAQEIDDFTQVMRTEMEKHVDFSAIAKRMLSETPAGGQG